MVSPIEVAIRTKVPLPLKGMPKPLPPLPIMLMPIWLAKVCAMVAIGFDMGVTMPQQPRARVLTAAWGSGVKGSWEQDLRARPGAEYAWLLGAIGRYLSSWHYY